MAVNEAQVVAATDESPAATEAASPAGVASETPLVAPRDEGTV